MSRGSFVLYFFLFVFVTGINFQPSLWGGYPANEHPRTFCSQQFVCPCQLVEMHRVRRQPSTRKVQLAIAKTAEKAVELPGFEAFMKVPSKINSRSSVCHQPCAIDTVSKGMDSDLSSIWCEMPHVFLYVRYSGSSGVLLYPSQAHVFASPVGTSVLVRCA